MDSRVERQGARRFLIAIEGPHGAGKTTLVMALTAKLKGLGLNAIALQEVTRSSPFVEEAAIFGGRPYSIRSQLQLLGAHISEEQLLLRNHRVVVSDRSIYNPIAYARLLLADDESLKVVEGMASLGREYGRFYDAIFFVSDDRVQSGEPDPYRPDDRDFWEGALSALETALLEADAPVLPVPTRLGGEATLDWVLGKLTDLLPELFAMS